MELVVDCELGCLGFDFVFKQEKMAACLVRHSSCITATAHLKKGLRREMASTVTESRFMFDQLPSLTV